MFDFAKALRRPKTPTSKDSRDGEKPDASNSNTSTPPTGLLQRFKATLGTSSSLTTLTDSSREQSKLSLPIPAQSGFDVQVLPEITYARSFQELASPTTSSPTRPAVSRGPPTGNTRREKTPDRALRSTSKYISDTSADPSPVDLSPRDRPVSPSKSGNPNSPLQASVASSSPSSSRASLARRKTEPERIPPRSGQDSESSVQRARSLLQQERANEERKPTPTADIPPLPKPLTDPPDNTPLLSRGSSSKSMKSKNKEPEGKDSVVFPPPAAPKRRSSTRHVNQVYQMPTGGRSVPILAQPKKGHQKSPSGQRAADTPPPMPQQAQQAQSRRTSYPAQFDAVIAVLGMTGAGKSFFIDKVTEGNGQGIGHSLASHTTEITTRTTSHPATGRSVLFIDTPGFDDTEMSDANEVLEMIFKWLEQSGAGEIKLAGIFYLHPISDNRMTGTALKNLRMFQKLCGKDALEKVVLLTTCWDEVNDQVGPRREKELIESFWSKMIRNRSQVARFDQSADSAWKAVDLLLSTTALNDSMPLHFMANGAGPPSVESAHEPTSTEEAGLPAGHLKDGSANTVQPPAAYINISLDDAIFLVMGMTGAGKSSFINHATRGNGQGVGDSLTSHTTQIITTRTKHPKTGKSVLFVDTPGFDNTHLSDTEVLQAIARWLEETYTDGIKLSGIFYLHPISDQRVAGTSLANLRMFEKLCGKDALQKVVFLTTFWDAIEEKIGLSREDNMKRTCWRTMIRSQSQVARFHQSFESAWAATDLLLSRRGKPALQLQKELVTEAKELRETQAGAALLTNLEELLARQQVALKNLMEERKEEGDPRYAKEIEQELVHLEKKIKLTVDQMQALTAPLPTTLRTFRNFFRRAGA